MIELIRLLLLLAIAAAGMTFVGSAIAWWSDEQRRLRRMASKVLGGTPDGVIVAPGRGMAAAFRLGAGQVLVMRDSGAKALLYRLETLNGAELIIDDAVAARVMRDEPRRVLDQINNGAGRVTLRLLFDDARHPDFSLELWAPEDAGRRGARPASAAIREARTWLGRAEAIIRRTAPPTPVAGATTAAEPPVATPRAQPPPWEDEPEGEIEPDDGNHDAMDPSGLGPEDYDPPRLL